MSLQNLLGISLEQITPQKETVRRLLDGADGSALSTLLKYDSACAAIACRPWDATGRTNMSVSPVGQRAAMRRALDLLSLASADDSLEHCPPCLINEVIVDRVASREHSVDKRPIERVHKGFQVEIG
jgi:hypothetical protein